MHRSNIQSFFLIPWESLHLVGISHSLSIWKEKKIFYLGSRKKVFLSSWISLFQLKLSRHPVSKQAENFGPAAQILLFRCSLAICKHFWISSGMWALSSLDVFFFESLYCANSLAGGRHAADKSFDPSESPTSCNRVFQLCKCYPQHREHLVTLRSLPLLLNFKQHHHPCLSMCHITFP